MIEIRGLQKSYTIYQKESGLRGSLKALFVRKFEEKKALANFSCSLAPGEMVGLIGANGAGKTTLVKILAGIMEPSSGEASVFGHVPWKRENAFRRQIALIMGQKSQLWWDLPALDCFRLLQRIYEIPEEEYQKRLGELTERLQVTGQLRTQMRRLSLGERMKMELVASLLHRPKVVFLDEPTIGLDHSSQNALRAFLKDYLVQYRPILILTSHYMADIEELCPRVLILKSGELVFDGKLDELRKIHLSKKRLQFRFGEHPPTQEKLVDYIREQFPDAQIRKFQDSELLLDVNPNDVSAAAGKILSEFSVLDLNVSDEDIAELVTKVTKS